MPREEAWEQYLYGEGLLHLLDTLFYVEYYRQVRYLSYALIIYADVNTMFWIF